MRKPTKLKEIQKLTGRVTTLSRFLARLGEKAMPFYALIKQGEKSEWNEEADKDFEHLKRTISKPPVLVAPKEKEPLLLYIAATPQVVNTVLVVEREEDGKIHGVQRPVYFISEVYVAYITRKEIPEDLVEARRVIRRSKAFTVVKGELYKQSISGVLQRCVTPEEG
ncbi:uncharacterized protein [Lolium perenne]|uniref:uncharacterized protein n=1 Tax=Lolium perenne TaxID=4522 RepID=UPI003A99933C